MPKADDASSSSLMHCQKRPYFGKDQVPRHEDKDNDDRKDELQARYPGNAHEPPGAAKDVDEPVGVVEEDPHEDAEAECRYGKEVIPQPQYGEADEIADEGGKKTAHEKYGQEWQGRLDGEDVGQVGGRIGADAVESRPVPGKTGPYSRR